LAVVNHCWMASIRLLKTGIMCRGYITRGALYHDGQNFRGTGFQNAVEKEKNVSAFRENEKENGTPFIELDPSVCEYIRTCNDTCVPKMFDRMTRTDGNVTAVFPFQALSHSFVIAGGEKFDPAREKVAAASLRAAILSLKDRVRVYIDLKNPNAIRKGEFYLKALDMQIAECDKVEEMIELLGRPACGTLDDP
jgi:hypothetical protein